MRSVLDVCCGSRMFYSDRNDLRVLFGDIRSERHYLPDVSSVGECRTLEIRPDAQFDFRALPFAGGSFPVVVFDPPHLVRAGKKSWLALKYGILGEKWTDDLAAGFKECFRVLRPNGVLIFKWAEIQIPLSKIIPLAAATPVIVQRMPRSIGTHWAIFIKEKCHAE